MFEKPFSKSKRIELQVKIRDFLTSCVKNSTGKGPSLVKVKILEDMIEIELRGFLTDYEKHLLEDEENIPLITQLRRAFYKKAQSNKQEISQILQREVEIIHKELDILKDTVKVFLIIK